MAGAARTLGAMSHLLRFTALALGLALCSLSLAATAKKAGPGVPADKDYTGLIVIDAGDGKTLVEDNADTAAYPASVTKLMNLLLCIDAIDSGKARLIDRVTITAEEAKMGGSQVFLKEGEVFSFEELLYAMMVQSANDAALACANHVGGTREAFVAAMNRRAAQLGMNHTKFVTPHGLASPKQEADVSTPRDIATVSREVIRHPLALSLTSTKKRTFRQEPLLEMQNHNKLLWQVPGCDGLKTGYLARGGYALSATVYQNGKRVIAVVMGSKGVYGRQRDAIARRVIAEALTKASPAPAALAPHEPEPAAAVPVGAEPDGVLPADGEGPDESAEQDGEAPMVHFRLPGAKPAK